MSERSDPLASGSHSASPSLDIKSRSRLAVTLGAAFALLCVSVFGFETAESFAAGGLIDFLFGGESGAAVAPFPSGYGYGAARRHYGHHRHSARHARRYHARYAYAHRRMAERRHAVIAGRRDASENVRRAESPERVSFAAMSAAAPPATPQALVRRSVCVRACDGYFFPIANLSKNSDISSQQSTCSKLCPGTQARLFIMQAGSDKIEDAVAARGGETYAALVARLNAADARTQSCGCQKNDGAATQQTSVFQTDYTLRPGDSVVTSQGVRILRRGSRYPYKERDFVSLAETQDVPLANRSALAAIERVLKTPHGRLLVANSERRRAAHRRDPHM